MGGGATPRKLRSEKKSNPFRVSLLAHQSFPLLLHWPVQLAYSVILSLYFSFMMPTKRHLLLSTRPQLVHKPRRFIHGGAVQPKDRN